MKKHLILLSLLYCTVGCSSQVMSQKRYTQHEMLTDTKHKSWLACYDSSKKEIYYLIWDTSKPIELKGEKVLYGYAGISVDSSKIYYRKYVALKRTGIPDSVNKYFKLLNNYKNK